MNRFLVLLDRDGTVIEEKVYLSDPEGVELTPGASEGLRRLQEAGAELVIVSNQSGIARGKFTEAEAQAVNRRMVEMLRREGVSIRAVYYCPHGPDDGCDCRKPAPGMLLRAAEETGLPLQDAVMVGDKAIDVEAGQRAGCRTVLVLTGYGRDMRDQCRPDFVAEDLREAAEWILAQRGATSKRGG